MADASSLQSELNKVARNTGIKLAGSVANALFGFALAIVITRGLHAGRAGSFFEALAIFTLCSTIGELGADTGLVRMIPRYRELGRVRDIPRTIAAGLVPVFALGTLMAVLLFVFAPQISHLLVSKHGVERSDVATYVRVLAPFLPFSSTSTVVLSAAIGFGTVTPFTLVDNFAKPGIRPIVAAAVILGGLGTVALALGWATPILAGLAVGLAILLRLTRRALRRNRAQSAPPRSQGAIIREFWSFAAPRALAGTLDSMLGTLGILLVGALSTTAGAAIYAVVQRLLQAGVFALQAVILVLSPQISAALARRDHDRAESLFQMSTWWLMIPSWPLYLAMAVFAPLILSIFGPDFSHAHSILLIMSLTLLVVMGTGPVTSVLLMGGFSRWNLLNSAVGLVTTVGLMVVLVPRFGLVGAAYAFAASLTLVNLGAAVEVAWLLGLDPLGPGFPVVAFAALGSYGGLGVLIRVALGMSAWTFILYLVVATAVYAAILWRFRRVVRLPALWDAIRQRVRDDPPAAARGPDRATAAPPAPRGGRHRRRRRQGFVG